MINGSHLVVILPICSAISKRYHTDQEVNQQLCPQESYLPSQPHSLSGTCLPLKPMCSRGQREQCGTVSVPLLRWHSQLVLEVSLPRNPERQSGLQMCHHLGVQVWKCTMLPKPLLNSIHDTLVWLTVPSLGHTLAVL